jgi:hypothetical protein
MNSKTRVQDFTSWRVTVWIGKLWALEGQFLLVVERVDPPKGKTISAVTCLKSGLVEFGHPLDQCFQARCQHRFFPLILNLRWKKMLVQPLGFGVHVNMKPFLGGTFPAATEFGVQVFMPMMTT